MWIVPVAVPIKRWRPCCALQHGANNCEDVRQRVCCGYLRTRGAGNLPRHLSISNECFVPGKDVGVAYLKEPCETGRDEDHPYSSSGKPCQKAWTIMHGTRIQHENSLPLALKGSESSDQKFRPLGQAFVRHPAGRSSLQHHVFAQLAANTFQQSFTAHVSVASNDFRQSLLNCNVVTDKRHVTESCLVGACVSSSRTKVPARLLLPMA